MLTVKVEDSDFARFAELQHGNKTRPGDPPPTEITVTLRLDPGMRETILRFREEAAERTVESAISYLMFLGQRHWAEREWEEKQAALKAARELLAGTGAAFEAARALLIAEGELAPAAP